MAATRASSTSTTLHLAGGVLLALAALLRPAAAFNSPMMMACAKTPHPDVCRNVLSKYPESNTADPRGLAEIAVKAASDIGAAAGTYARGELDVVKDQDTWQCLDECAEDIEEAVSHLDDTEGDVDINAKFKDVRLFMDNAERDSWSCDESCRDAPPSLVKAAILAKNDEFESIMRVTTALISLAVGDAAPTTAPKPKKP